MFKLIRGDTETIIIGFEKNRTEYFPQDLKDGDKFTFTVRSLSRIILLQKSFSYPETHFFLTHEDTKELPLGNFYYDVKYSKTDKSIVKTLVIGTLKIVGEPND